MSTTISSQIARIAADKKKIQDKLISLKANDHLTALAKDSDNLDVLALTIENITNLGKIEGSLIAGSSSITIGAGYTEGGSISIDVESKIATPSKTQQTISPEEGKVLSDVVVKAVDITLPKAGTILTGSSVSVKSGETVLDSVSGTMTNNENWSTTIKLDSDNTGNVTVPAGYHDGTGTVSATIDNAVVSINAPSAAVKPVISKGTKQDGEVNWIDASSSAATTSPEANNVYVKVSTAANTSNYTPTASITSKGYTNENSYTGTTTTVGAVASDTTYIPIDTAEVSLNSPATAVTPEISRQAFTGSDELFDASSGADATTVVPTKGVYVKVKTADLLSNYTPKATVNTAGYTTESDYTGTTISVGATASADTYIPIKVATIPEDVDLNGGQTATITAGYLTRDITISANAVSGQTVGSATADKILAGETAWVNGTKVTGTMPNNGETSGTITKPGDIVTIPLGYTSGGTVSANITEGSLTISKSELITGENASFTQSKVILSPGWVNNVNGEDGVTLIKGATFTNAAQGTTTYKDISDTTAAPILISDSYLYINKGYTDNVKISLAKLVPDEANITVADGADYILADKTAYDKDGKLITGTIPSIEETTYKAGNTETEIISSGNYTSGVQKIAAVTLNNEAIAENVVAGKTITVKSGDTVLYNLAGTFSADATATADQIFKGKTAYVNGQKVTGTVAIKSELANEDSGIESGNITVNPYVDEMDEDVTDAGVLIPAGFYDGTSKIYISDDIYDALGAI